MATPALVVAAAPHTAGARPVAITIVARYEMQCGWPGRGRLVVRFPAGMRIPVTPPAGSARVDGSAVTPVVSQRSIAVALPKRPQIMCDSIGPGTLTVTFTRAVELGSPKAAGSYVLRATHGADSVIGTLRITR
jgi:hypothetical protein